MRKNFYLLKETEDGYSYSAIDTKTGAEIETIGEWEGAIPARGKWGIVANEDDDCFLVDLEKGGEVVKKVASLDVKNYPYAAQTEKYPEFEKYSVVEMLAERYSSLNSVKIIGRDGSDTGKVESCNDAPTVEDYGYEEGYDVVRNEDDREALIEDGVSFLCDAANELEIYFDEKEIRESAAASVSVPESGKVNVYMAAISKKGYTLIATLDLDDAWGSSESESTWWRYSIEQLYSE